MGPAVAGACRGAGVRWGCRGAGAGALGLGALLVPWGLGPWGLGAGGLGTKCLACESDTEEGGLNYKVFKVTFLSFRFGGCPSVA